MSDEQQAAPAAELSAADALQQVMDSHAAEGQETPEGTEEPKVKVAEQLQKDDKFAAKFAALGRKERELKMLERKIQEQQKALQAPKAEAAPEAKVDPSKDPIGFLKANGLSVEQFMEMIVNDGKPTEDMRFAEVEKKTMSRIEQLEKQLADKETKEAQAKADQQLHDFKQNLSSFVTADKEAYELINDEDAVDLVYDVIETHYNTTHAETGEGVILSNKEAADAVEAYLLDQAKKRLALKKVQKLTQPSQAQEKQLGASTGAKTLSNTQAAQVPQKSSRFLSDEESKKQAASLIRFTED